MSVEFQLVDHGVVWPQTCVACGSGKGPLVDTHAERWGERLYLCKLCTQRAGRALGIVKGDRMVELLNAGDLLADKDQQIERGNQAHEELRQVNASLRADVKELKGELAAATGKLEQTAHLAAQLERSAHELLEAAAEVPA